MAIKISGSTIIDDSRNIVNAGVVTATSFIGDGSALTGVGVGASDSINTTGIITASAVSANEFIGTGDKLIFSPSITSFSPTDGATGVSATNSPNISITYDQLVTLGVGTITLRKDSASGDIVESFQVGVSTRVTANNQTLTITPTDNFDYDREYYVVIPDKAVTNAVGGNPGAALTTYNFSAEQLALGSSYGGGFVICKSSGTRWIVAPASSEVSRTWYTRNDANTRAQQVSGCTGWFVPTISQLVNPGVTCQQYWDSCSSLYWSSSEINSSHAWRTGMYSGAFQDRNKTTAYCVRAFRCVTY